MGLLQNSGRDDSGVREVWVLEEEENIQPGRHGFGTPRQGLSGPMGDLSAQLLEVDGHFYAETKNTPFCDLEHRQPRCSMGWLYS